MDGKHSNEIGPQSVAGVVGVGVVGGALADYFETQGLGVVTYDKFKQVGSMSEIDAKASLIFVCVPTPYDPARGFDSSAVEEAIAELRQPHIVVIKSTVQPGTTGKLQQRFPQHDIFFNPEFLREKTAAADFLNPDRQLVGYAKDNPVLAESILRLMPRAPYEAVLDATSAELVKTATNSFLAMKLMFANEMFDLCGALGIDYEDVRAGLAADLRIGGSHFDVMDGGYRGYGGKCLPKDTMGLIDLAEALATPLELLKTAHKLNERLTGDDAARERAA